MATCAVLVLAAEEQILNEAFGCAPELSCRWEVPFVWNLD